MLSRSPHRRRINRDFSTAKQALIRALAVVALCAIAGCAFDISQVTRVPTAFQSATPDGSGWTLRQEQSIGVGSGFPTKLRAGTRWQLAGHVPQGNVYRTSDQIVTVEASNIYEAMMVTQGDNCVGFYLPVDRAFVAATSPVALAMEQGNQ